MAELNDWDVTAANNNSAPPNGWPENTMQYSEVNDTAREGMAVLKRYFADMNGTLAAGGVANAYTLTLNAAYAAYFDGMMFRCSFTAANTGASTINVNSLGVRNIINADGSALSANQILTTGSYLLVYNGTAFQLVDGALGDLALASTISNDDWSGTDLAVANGGTGASDAATARSNLGLAIGTNVQAQSAALDDLDALGTVEGSGAFIVSVGAGVWNYQLGATARASMGLGSIATQDSTSVAITGGSISGITDLAVADGGTGGSTAAAARTNLGAQAQDDHLDDIAAVAPPTGADQVLVSTGAGAYALESGATLRTSLGLGTANTPQFTGLDIGGTDCTITRDGAGQLAIEGDAIFTHDSATYTSSKIFFSTAAPTTEGNNGDIYFEYTA